MDRLGKPLSLSGVYMCVDSGKKKIEIAYIIDMLKLVAAHVKPCVFKKFSDIYDEALHRPQPVCD